MVTKGKATTERRNYFRRLEDRIVLVSFHSQRRRDDSELLSSASNDDNRRILFLSPLAPRRNDDFVFSPYFSSRLPRLCRLPSPFSLRYNRSTTIRKSNSTKDQRNSAFLRSNLHGATRRRSADPLMSTFYSTPQSPSIFDCVSSTFLSLALSLSLTLHSAPKLSFLSLPSTR